MATATATAVELPRVMKGCLVERHGGVEELQYRTDLPVPVPSEGQVLVRNEFIGVNYIDTYFRSGLYPHALPLVPGREGEGTIVSLGPSHSLPTIQAKQRVWYHTSPLLGSYAEYTVVSSSQVIALPTALPPGQASATLFQALTALILMRESHPVKKDEWCLVHAAAGGVGLWFCQLLHAVGARVIGSAGGEEKCKLARENGAEWCLDYRSDEFSDKELLARRIIEISGGAGVHVIFDGVGKDMWELDLDVVRKGGMIVSYGNASGPVPPFSIARLGPKCVKVCRPVWTNYLDTRERLVEYADEFLELLKQHHLNIRVHKTYALDEARQAHKDIEARISTGKLLLKV